MTPGFQGAHVTQAKLCRMLQPWTEPQKDDVQIHAMISYRWGKTDSAMADALFDVLSARELHSQALYIFQDHRRLKTGDNFKHSFLRAMTRSMVVLPLVSWDALKRMTTLTADSECDNVLLEWTLAAELAERTGLNIQPVFIGSLSVGSDGRQKMLNLFEERPPLLSDNGRTSVLDDSTGHPKPDQRSVFDRVPHVVVASVYKVWSPRTMEHPPRSPRP